MEAITGEECLRGGQLNGLVGPLEAMGGPVEKNRKKSVVIMTPR